MVRGGSWLWLTSRREATEIDQEGGHEGGGPEKSKGEFEVQLTKYGAGFPGGAARAEGIQDDSGALREVGLGWVGCILDSTL